MMILIVVFFFFSQNIKFELEFKAVATKLYQKLYHPTIEKHFFLKKKNKKRKKKQKKDKKKTRHLATADALQCLLDAAGEDEVACQAGRELDLLAAARVGADQHLAAVGAVCVVCVCVVF